MGLSRLAHELLGKLVQSLKMGGMVLQRLDGSGFEPASLWSLHVCIPVSSHSGMLDMHVIGGSIISHMCVLFASLA